VGLPDAALIKRAPPSIHCGLTLSPMTSSPGRGGSAEELLCGLVVLSGAHSLPFLGVGLGM
jgi:hypothetical protein